VSSFKPILKVSRPPTLGRCWWCRSCLPVLRSRRVTFRLGVRPRSTRLWCCAWSRKREPRRVVSQAILPAAGIRAGSALDVQSRPAGWKAGSSQDWLPTWHYFGSPVCGSMLRLLVTVPSALLVAAKVT
jgi:hypothetical protein